MAICPKGGLALECLAQLVASGAPTRARVPYQPSGDYFTMIESQGDFPESSPEMERFRIGSYATFQIHTDPAATVRMIKEYIANVRPAEGQTGTQTLSFVQDAGVVRDMSEGHLNTTSAPFDMAIHGKGFFVVQTPNGERYTRNGLLDSAAMKPIARGGYHDYSVLSESFTMRRPTSVAEAAPQPRELEGTGTGG